MAAVSAIILVTAISLATIPYSQTVRQDIHPDILWRSGLWQQVTGFLLLGFSFVGFSLYLRKHWRRLRFGSFSSWRTLHAILGATGLTVLVAHTGMRFGSKSEHGTDDSVRGCQSGRRACGRRHMVAVSVCKAPQPHVEKAYDLDTLANTLAASRPHSPAHSISLLLLRINQRCALEFPGDF